MGRGGHNKYTPEQFIDHFWARVSEPDNNGCRTWTGSTNDGYGSVKFNGKNVSTHKVSWILSNGEIPDGLCVMHRCDNRPCCEPSHLLLGTYDDNNKDKASKGRAINGNAYKETCPKGHPYSGINNRGDRKCHTCDANNARRYRAKRRAAK